MMVDKIKKIMKEKRISQKQVAEHLEKCIGKRYSQAMVSKRLKSDRKLNSVEMKYILDLLNTKYEDISQDYNLR